MKKIQFELTFEEAKTLGYILNCRQPDVDQETVKIIRQKHAMAMILSTNKNKSIVR